MSYQAVSWVLANSPATGVHRLVLIVLAEHARKDGVGARPSQATIARKAACSRRAVQYALEELEGAGAIRRTGRGRGGTVAYEVVMSDEAKAAAIVPRRSARWCASEAEVEGAQSALPEAHDGALRGAHQGAHEPSFNHPGTTPRGVDDERAVRAKRAPMLTLRLSARPSVHRSPSVIFQGGRG